MDVKKIGRIPDGGGWRAHGRQAGSVARDRKNRVGFDYVHSIVDDHSRAAYSEILADETAATTAGFFSRAIDHLATLGISRIAAVMTDNAWNYTRSRDLAALLERLDARPSSSNRTAPGRTAKWNGSTAHSRPNGLTSASSRATTPAPPPSAPGSTTTTTNVATAPSGACHQSADCHQPDGRVHLEPPPTQLATRHRCPAGSVRGGAAFRLRRRCAGPVPVPSPPRHRGVGARPRSGPVAG